MKTYLHKTSRGVHEVVTFENALEKGHETGRTFEDYSNGCWIELSDEQVRFYNINSTASAREIIEMEMTPLPESNLDWEKVRATETVGWQAVSRIEELFPLSLIRDVIFGRMNEEEVAQLHIEYNNAITALGMALVDTHDRIDNAVSVDDTQSAVEDFGNQAAYVVPDRDNGSFVDSLVDAGRDARVREEENRRTW